VQNDNPFRLANGKLTYNSIRAITQLSFVFGVIPKSCAICGRKVVWRTVRFHLWGHLRQSKCVQEGLYRRMCWSCSRALSRKFGEDMPSWEKQYAFLKDEQGLTEDAVEGWWSVITEYEENEVLKRLGEK